MPVTVRGAYSGKVSPGRWTDHHVAGRYGRG